MSKDQVRIRELVRAMVVVTAVLIAIEWQGVAPARGADVEAARRDLVQQELILLDRAATAAQREEAARRLVSRASREANAILLRIVSDFGNTPAQMAVAKALSSSTSPDPAFISPLGNLLGNEREVTAAAAAALAVYKMDDRARDKLTVFVNNLSQQVTSRVAAIRAMGKLVDKRAAGSLIDLMNRENENSLARDAAADALIEMTGLSRYGRDVQQWNQWWQVSQGKSELEWSTDLLIKNAVRANELYNQLQKDGKFIARVIREEYQNKETPEADREKKLIGYLRAEAEGARLAAVDLIYDEATQFGGGRISGAILEALRGMVGDSSTEVRVRVARTLTTANDPGAVEALLTQLTQEKDADVKAAILEALGPSRDLRAVEPLLKGLSDPTFSVARAAADGLRDLAGVLREAKNAALAGEVARRLRERLPGTENVSAAKLRESIVEAMAKLGERSLRPVFIELLNPGRESARIRIAALRGLGLIGDRDTANMIVSTLNDSQAGVRLAAAEALLATASYENARGIAPRLSENVERDPDVRAAVWKVMLSLLEKATANEVLVWAEQFKQEGDNDQALGRRAMALAIAEKKLAAGSEDMKLAVVRQNLGETLLKLGKADEAATNLRAALDYWTTHNASEAVTNLPKQQLMEALLRGRKYADAAEFATKLIGDNKAATPDMWGKVNREVKRLRDSRDAEGATALIEAAKAIPWGDYAAQLKRLEEQVKKDRNTGGRVWVRQSRSYGHAVGWGATAA